MREQTYAYARDLADFVSPSAISVIKRQLYDVPFQTLAEATIDANREMQIALKGSDFREGVASFVEKRRADSLRGSEGDGSRVGLPRPAFALRATPRHAFATMEACLARSSAQPAKRGGARRDRTADLVIANDALSQLSYGPVATASK